MFIVVCGGMITLPLTFAHLYVAIANVTTWEFASSHRITYLRNIEPGVNPFHLGYIRNVVTFLCSCRAQNWERLYVKYRQKSGDKLDTSHDCYDVHDITQQL
jgi:hypothetical protein